MAGKFSTAPGFPYREVPGKSTKLTKWAIMGNIIISVIKCISVIKPFLSKLLLYPSLIEGYYLI